MGIKEKEAVYYMLFWKYMKENDFRGNSKIYTLMHQCHYKALQVANFILAAIDENLDDCDLSFDS